MDELQPTKGEQTRREILAAAKSLFLAQGYTATSMRQIAQTVGITPAAIYNHFPGKNEIFDAVLRDTAPYDEAYVMLGNVGGDTPEELIAQTMRKFVHFGIDHQAYVHLAQIDAHERAGATLSTLLPEVLPNLEPWYRRLLALDAAAGATTGTSRLRDVSFYVLFRSMLSLLIGYMTTRPISAIALVPDMTDDDWAQALVDILLHGLVERPATNEE